MGRARKNDRRIAMKVDHAVRLVVGICATCSTCPPWTCLEPAEVRGKRRMHRVLHLVVSDTCLHLIRS